jgi:hypothetical protein
MRMLSETSYAKCIFGDMESTRGAEQNASPLFLGRRSRTFLRVGRPIAVFWGTL